MCNTLVEKNYEYININVVEWWSHLLLPVDANGLLKCVVKSQKLRNDCFLHMINIVQYTILFVHQKLANNMYTPYEVDIALLPTRVVTF